MQSLRPVRLGGELKCQVHMDIVLYTAAYRLADEIRDGKWKHVSDLSKKPVPQCDELIRELERRCPGYADCVYREAMAKGIQDSR